MKNISDPHQLEADEDFIHSLTAEKHLSGEAEMIKQFSLQKYENFVARARFSALLPQSTFRPEAVYRIKAV